MRRAQWLSLVFLLSLTAVAIAGDIQVSCPPGLRVYLDGEPVGISSVEQDGLYLMDVPRGTHIIRLEKDGHIPRSLRVEILDLPVDVRVDDLVPEPPPHFEPPTPAPEATAQLGRLVVTSAPQNCVVEVDGRAQTKSSPQLEIGALPPGEHTIRFSKPGFEPISGAVAIRSGAEHTVRGNLVAGRVEVVHHGKGSLRVTSKPARCTVRFSGRTHEKIHAKLNLSHVPAGEHELSVSWGGRELSSRVLINDGRRTIVAVSFMPGDEPIVITHEPE